MNLPAAPDTDLRGISLRGRMGLALTCLEASVRHLQLDGAGWLTLRERLWRITSAPAQDWRAVELPRDYREISALFGLPDDPALAVETYGLDLLRRVFHQLDEVRERILSEPVRGWCDGSHDALEGMLAGLLTHGIPAPDPAPFLRSGFVEEGGWGRSVLPAFFREGIERADFAAWLGPALRSSSVYDRREATWALCHVGLPAESVRDPLAEIADGDSDPEARSFAQHALRILFGNAMPRPAPREIEPIPAAIPDLRSYWRQRFPRRTAVSGASGGFLTTLEDLHHGDPEHRRASAEAARSLVASRPEFIPPLLFLLRSDLVCDVRLAAALALSEAPFSPELLALLLSALDDAHVDVRAGAAFAIGCLGPRAVPAVPALLRLMTETDDDLFTSAAAFHASEALESIGTAAVSAIVRQIVSGDAERVRRCLRKVAQRPEMVERTIAELNLQLVDEPWLRPRVAQATAILKPNS